MSEIKYPPPYQKSDITNGPKPQNRPGIERIWRMVLGGWGEN